MMNLIDKIKQLKYPYNSHDLGYDYHKGYNKALDDVLKLFDESNEPITLKKMCEDNNIPLTDYKVTDNK